ncbi:MAG: hypothetical protein AMDU5_GPLC00012G0032 [Thermoplasmatales archaeon Gpl]|nr:MAG: hypothetical protein AMDU5_GPLC00012G0032 [Thermoplasmatales archaeon Gpl]
MTFEISTFEIPIAIRALRTASIYILDDGKNKILIDTGMDDQIDTFLESRGVDIENINMVLLTHLHIDHVGGVNKLHNNYNLNGYIGKEDLRRIEAIQSSAKGFISWQIDYLRRNGVPDKFLENLTESHPVFRELKNYLDLKLEPLEAIKNLPNGIRTLHVPGHSPGSTCYFVNDSTALMSGDHILERITPNISYYDEEEDMLGEYLSSLIKTKNIKVKATFPGHGKPFGNQNERIDQLIKHHGDRMNEIMELVRDKWLTAYETAHKMRWSKGRTMESMNMMESNFAIGEVISHLRHMESTGTLDKKEIGGIYYYGSSSI